jgi:hypothetical protein
MYTLSVAQPTCWAFFFEAIPCAKHPQLFSIFSFYSRLFQWAKHLNAPTLPHLMYHLKLPI